MTISYVELHCRSNFSFLEGASHPDELVEQAAQLGYSGIAITDRHSVAGVVRGWAPAKQADLDYIVGAEVHPRDTPPIVLWPTDRAAYGRLCRLLSRGRMRAAKGACELHWDDLVELNDGLLAGVLPGGVEQAFLDHFRDAFGDRGYLLCELHLGVDDRAAVDRLAERSRCSGLPLLAAGNIHYHVPGRALLHDCVTAIRCGATIDQVQGQRFVNAERHLRQLDEIAHVYRHCRDAVRRTIEVAQRCRFRLDQLRYEYPEELAPPGMSAIEHLKRLTWEGAKQRWPEGVPDKVIQTLRHEIGLIQELRYEAYFLTVWDLVRFARSRGILCQGRGSAANSVVCYCLGITSVDPSLGDLLFERFISRERGEAPDIDVDFEHQRREEVIQYVYQKYGRDSAGMTAAVISYRTRSAVRDVGKALGLGGTQIDSLAKLADGDATGPAIDRWCRESDLDPESPVGSRLVELVSQLVGFPRHLSQHVGGMVMTQGSLCELCPVENASMAGRTVVQWDKNDLDELGILKVDLLSLGMLSALRRCFDLVAEHHGQRWSLSTIPPNDQPTYEMICQADTIGVFQIESRAQMSMLPRLRPRCFYDLVIEVAIVRPGPIQGQMVHPFLQARADPAAVRYPNEAIRKVLEKTLGVPLFQEQAMRLAVVAAGFSAGEADQLRRAMAAWRRPGVIDRFRTKLIEGMARNGLTGQFAEQVFRQIKGFGEYGFPESHAASFALLVYASCYLKRHYPAAFCAALINSQPMGFYAPAQLVWDARRHGVPVRPADVNHSHWDCTLHQGGDAVGLTLGLRMIKGLPRQAAERIVAARTDSGPYRDQADLRRRTELSAAVLTTLADADALGSITEDRRAAIWHSLAQENSTATRPLLDAVDDDEELLPDALPTMPEPEQVHADYRTTGLSLKAHPISFLRESLAQRGCVRAADLPELRHGRHVRVAGLVLLRQRPSTAKGVTFVTLEDETGPMNLIFFAKLWQRYRQVVTSSGAWMVQGKLENRQNVIHIIPASVEDLTDQLPKLNIASRDFR